MDPDRGHLSLAIPTSQTQQSSQSSQQQQHQQQSQQQQSQAQQPSENINSEPQDGSPISVKRGPGRPKGSTKKLFEPDPSSVTKIKRPVGRPRKDGRPAGSVPKIPRAPGRPRKNFPAEFPDWVSFQGMFGNYRLPKDGSVAAGASDSKAGPSNGVHSGTNGVSTSLSQTLPTAQIPDLVLATIYSLFSRSTPPNNELPIPKEAIIAYKTHINNLSRTVSRAYSILKTFWLPFSPLLFRLVSPRTSTPAKGFNPNKNPSNGLQTKSSASSYLAYPQLNQPNGDLHSNRHSSVPSSEQAYEAHRFFYWDPFNLPLCGTLTCPQCQTPLTHNGLIRTGPLRVFDLPSGVSPTGTAHWQAGLVPAVFYVIGVHYLCPDGSCSAKYNSWDSKIVNNLPPMLADEWPVYTESVGTGLANAVAGSGSASVSGGGSGTSAGANGVNGETASSSSSVGGTIGASGSGSTLTTGSERTDSRGSKWNGDAISRPLFTLTRTLIQNGTSLQGVRDILGQMWRGDEEDKEEDVEEEEEEEDFLEEEGAEAEKEKAAEAEAVFSNPYAKIVSATQLTQTQDNDTSFEDNLSDSRPPKRQKTNDLPSFLSPAFGSTTINPAMTTTATTSSSTAAVTGHSHSHSHSGYISRPSTADVVGSSGMPLHVSPSQTQNQLQTSSHGQHEQQQHHQSQAVRTTTTNGSSLHHHLNHRSSSRLDQQQQHQHQAAHSMHPPHSHSHSQHSHSAAQHHASQTMQSQNLHAAHSSSNSHSHPQTQQSQTQAHPQNHSADSSLLRRHPSQSHQQQQTHMQPSHLQMHPPPLRTLPSPRDVLGASTATTTTTAAHNHHAASHHATLPPPTSATNLHTPSPVYPPMSLPNSTANSPQAGNRLSLKRAFDDLTPLPNGTAAAGSGMSSLAGGGGSSGAGSTGGGGGGSATPANGPLPSPAQTHYHGLGHNSPFPPGRPLHHLTHPHTQQQHPGQQHQQHQQHAQQPTHGHASYQQQQHQQHQQSQQQQHQQHQSSVSSVAAAVNSAQVGARQSALGPGSGQQNAHTLQIHPLNLSHSVSLPRFPHMLNSNTSSITAGAANATGLSMSSHHHQPSSLLPPPHPHSVTHSSVPPPPPLQTSSSLSSHHHHPGHPHQQQPQQHSQSMQQGPTHMNLHPQSHLRAPHMQLPVPGPTASHPQSLPQQTHHLSHSHSHSHHPQAQPQPIPQQQGALGTGSHQGSTTSHAPQRRVRHCVKCGQHECKGKGGAQFCKNPCKDCGQMDCRGRNSKRPNATCREGW